MKWASRLAIQAFSKQEIPSQNKNSHHFVSQNWWHSQFLCSSFSTKSGGFSYVCHVCVTDWFGESGRREGFDKHIKSKENCKWERVRFVKSPIFLKTMIRPVWLSSDELRSCFSDCAHGPRSRKPKFSVLLRGRKDFHSKRLHQSIWNCYKCRKENMTLQTPFPSPSSLLFLWVCKSYHRSANQLGVSWCDWSPKWSTPNCVAHSQTHT